MKAIAGIVASWIVALATAAHAYTLVNTDPNNLVPRRWAGSSPSILFQLNDDALGQLPNVEVGSNPVAALGRALSTWQGVANISFTSQMTFVESVGGDDINLITLRDTTANRMAIEMAGGPLALTIVRSQGTTLVEADIVFNPLEDFTTLRNTDDALQQGDIFDVEAIAAHELGHAIGLHHTGDMAATMWSLSAVRQRSLDADDRTGARVLYPSGPAGRIRGQVLIGPTQAFGAHVVATLNGRVVGTALTLVNGNYVIDGLDPGDYVLYVEPLDGPHSSIPQMSCVTLGNLSGAGIYTNATLHTQFVTTFFPNNSAPATVHVVAGADTVASFALTQGGTTLNPTLIGPAMIDGGSFGFSARPTAIELTAGQQHDIAVLGPGLEAIDESNISFVGGQITIDAGSLISTSIQCGFTLPALVFTVNVAANASSGVHSVLLRRGGDVAVLTGAVEVQGGVDVPTPTPVATSTATQPLPTATLPPPTPTRTPGDACVGDCDGDGTVTVDEIVIMVNIALGNRDVEDCESGDSDGSGTVTVDEILTAIQNALNGC